MIEEFPACHVVGGGAKSSSRNSNEEEVPLLKKSADIMDKYMEDGFVFDDDFTVIKGIAVEAEDSKDEVANLYRALYSNNRSFIILSDRCERSALHVEELCNSASSLYQEVLDTGKVEDAQAYLSDAEHYAGLANTWVNNASVYITKMEDIYSDDKNKDYATIATDAIENTSKCYENAVAENENLLVIGISGGSYYVASTERCIREANDWYSSMTQELENEEVVYSSSYKIATDAYTNATETYDKMMTKCNEALVYVDGLSNKK